MISTKAEIRRATLRRRGVAHGSGLDGAARAALDEALAPWRGQALSGYVPIGTEVDPLPVMARWESPVCVPVVRGVGLPLEFHRWTPGCEMVEGPFGVPVPVASEVVRPRVLIVPLVAFDSRGHRLGYGGGFYDRTLERMRGSSATWAVGFAYAAQEVECLRVEPTDQPLDAVVTEGGELRFRPLNDD
ncbi:MAG: 5-formyltetrahydrofolate cyclo-ligase [Rhodobacter sp.]|nr:5-formyltetrahydrofolate cyclo-ligase [Rhodobacter sp.]